MHRRTQWTLWYMDIANLWHQVGAENGEFFREFKNVKKGARQLKAMFPAAKIQVREERTVLFL